MAHPLFGPEVRLMLQENDDAEMRAFCENLHPATVAEALAEGFTVEEVWRVLEHTSIREQAAVFEYFPIEWQVQMVGGTGKPHMARLIEQMSHDDRVDLLRRLSPQAAESILRLVDEADRRDIAALVKYPEGTVGAIMTTDYAWLPATLTAADAIERLRQQAPERETIYYVYVLEEGSRRLLGVVTLQDLILAPRTAVLSNLMDRELVTLQAGDDREKAAQEMARYDLIALPVVNDEGRLVGIITHDDVIDVVVQEATEDMQRQAGVGTITENYLEAGFVTIWRKRAVWLACLFGAELFTFTAMASFEDEIDKLVVLSLFVPLCISTGGNSGSQAATLITRALALGQIRLGDWRRIVTHEVFMGLALGLTLGGIGFVRGALTPEKTRSSDKVSEEPFHVRVAPNEPLRTDERGRLILPKGSVYLPEAPLDRGGRVMLPPGEQPVEEPGQGGEKLYHFPKGSTFGTPPVDRWRLALVIAQAVAGICIWGTLVGSMLPLVFKRLGADPGIASSPFVATFVDVTGIVIYFTIAKIYLL